MKLQHLVDAMEEIAPTKLAESWDNVGLLVGDRSDALAGIMLTLDLTDDVLTEAIEAGCSAVVAYHPTIFDGIKRVTAPGLVYRAIRAGVAIYSPHTALDSAPGGTNDMLADVLGLTDARPIKLAEARQTDCKLVTFVPESAVEAVAQAVFAAGAGGIGRYTQCSFRSTGTGTFLGDETTNPTVGEPGKLERAPEIRFETILGLNRLEQVVAALRKAHPYEEPAFDLVPMLAEPSGIGMGRIGNVGPISRQKLIERIRAELGVAHLLVAGPLDGDISKAAACPGSCGKLMNDAIQAGAQLYLTGEVRHHDALSAAARGVTVVCALHSNSERKILQILAEKVRQALPGASVTTSQRDCDPFTIL